MKLLLCVSHTQRGSTRDIFLTRSLPSELLPLAAALRNPEQKRLESASTPPPLLSVSDLPIFPKAEGFVHVALHCIGSPTTTMAKDVGRQCLSSGPFPSQGNYSAGMTCSAAWRATRAREGGQGSCEKARSFRLGRVPVTGSTRREHRAPGYNRLHLLRALEQGPGLGRAHHSPGSWREAGSHSAGVGGA